MSVEGYFDKIISIWYDGETKHTPTLKRDMKECIRQFEYAVKAEEIPEDRVKDLQNAFSRIYKEVYN